MKGLFRSGAVVAGTLLLVACGGEGSGSSDSGEETSPGTKLSLDTNGYASKTVAISKESNIEPIAQLFADMGEAFDLINTLDDEAGKIFIEDSNTRVCSGGGTITLSQNASSPNSDNSWTFNNCVFDIAGYGSILFNGNYREVDKVKDETAITFRRMGYDQYDITGKLQSTGETLTLKGRRDFDEPETSEAGDENYRIVLTTDALEFKIGEKYVAMTNQRSDQEGEEYDVTVDLSSRWLGSAIGGYIQISTPTPITYPTVDSTCPTDGIMRFESDGVAEFRYGPSASGTAQAMAIWLNDQLVASYDSCDDIEFSPAE